MLRTMPMPAIASDRLVDLHNDLTDYDTIVAKLMREFLRGHSINKNDARIDVELEESLRSFKTESAAEVECRRELLRYKRRIDEVIRELLRLLSQNGHSASVSDELDDMDWHKGHHLTVTAFVCKRVTIDLIISRDSVSNIEYLIFDIDKSKVCKHHN